MASIFKKRGRWWCRLKGLKIAGKWGSKPTPYAIGTDEDEDSALRYAQTAQVTIDQRHVLKPDSQLTVAQYADKWLAVRSTLGLEAYPDDVGRLRNHVLPHIGHLKMSEVRARHWRDVIRLLRRNEDLAPRTIISINGVARTMFRDAEVEEVITTNPVKLTHGELPEKSDKDPEWRELATFTMAEVLQLLTDPRLLVERRVQYAMKSLAGLRHGEVAGLRWRLWDPTLEPLGRLSIARSYGKKRTKTEVTRAVPVHPLLAKILTAWREQHYERIYGDPATPDDLIVQTRNQTMIGATEAGVAFKDDLRRLGLRVDAGQHRARGGHDLRAWFISTALEHGASIEALQRVTHTKKKDVMSGYTRLPWPTICGAVSALRIDVGDKDPLAVCDQLVTREVSAMNRWLKARPRRDSKATEWSLEPPNDTASAGDRPAIVTSCDLSLSLLDTRSCVRGLSHDSDGYANNSGSNDREDFEPEAPLADGAKTSGDIEGKR